MDPTRAPLHVVSEVLSARALRATEVTEAYLARSRRSTLGAWLHLDEEGALRAAAEADARRGRGEDGPLLGVPIAVKDNLCTAGVPTTCASRILEGWIPRWDATCVTRLRAAGAVLLGKTNLDELAMGSSTERSAFGPARNPWDPTRIPGGSSGGSAVAVAAGLAAGALGSDTGGSIRQPAAMCGVVGLKPTWGRVSRYGLVAFASSFDQVGPFGRAVKDVALLHAAVAGPDPRDATCADRPVGDVLGPLGAGVAGMRIGVLAEGAGEGVAAPIRASLARATTRLRELGAQVVEVALPHAAFAISIYYLIAAAEAASNLGRFDGVRFGHRTSGPTPDLASLFTRSRGEGFGPEVKRRILLGTYALSAGYHDATYNRAQALRAALCEDFGGAFGRCDVLLGPTTPTPAFPLGACIDDPLAMYLADVFTIPANLAGLPALSLPAGLDDAGLPIGLHLTAPAFEEARLLRVASALEDALGRLGPPPEPAARQP